MLKLLKGGQGSGGARPGAGRKPGSHGTQIGPKHPYRSGVRPSAAYPYGRNPDGSPRTANDIRDTDKPPVHTERPKKQ